MNELDEWEVKPEEALRYFKLVKEKNNKKIPIYPLTRNKEFVYYGYPSEENLKDLYRYGFTLIRIKDNRYYFIDKNAQI